MSERTLSELVTHSPAGLGRPRSMTKGKAVTSRLKPASKKPAVAREATPELTETELQDDDEEEEEEESLELAESSLDDSDASQSGATSGRTISRAAHVPFPGQWVLHILNSLVP